MRNAISTRATGWVITIALLLTALMAVSASSPQQAGAIGDPTVLTGHILLSDSDVSLPVTLDLQSNDGSGFVTFDSWTGSTSGVGGFTWPRSVPSDVDLRLVATVVGYDQQSSANFMLTAGTGLTATVDMMLAPSDAIHTGVSGTLIAEGTVEPVPGVLARAYHIVLGDDNREVASAESGTDGTYSLADTYLAVGETYVVKLTAPGFATEVSDAFVYDGSPRTIDRAMRALVAGPSLVHEWTAASAPADVAVDADGNIWISDATGGAVRKYDSDHNLLPWSPEVAFNQPHEIAVDSAGDVYVVDGGTVYRFGSRSFNSHEVRKVSGITGGTLWSFNMIDRYDSWGGTSIAVYDGTVYVLTDQQLSLVNATTGAPANGDVVASMFPRDLTGLCCGGAPRGIAVDASGVYVAVVHTAGHGVPNAVYRFGFDGTRIWNKEVASAPTGLALDASSVFVAVGSSVYTLDKADGSEIALWGNGELDALGIGTDVDGNVYLPNKSVNTIQMYGEIRPAAVTYTITANAGDNGTIDPAGQVVVDAGSSQTFNFSAAAGYHVETLAIDGEPAKATAATSYTFADITGDHSIAVTFAQNKLADPYAVTFGPAPTGTMIMWAGSPGATGYRVISNGQVLGTTGPSVSSLLVRAIFGPKAVITVTAIGAGDSSSAAVPAAYTTTSARGVKIGSVSFKGNSAKLTPAAKKALRRYAALMATQGFTSVSVSGYTSKSAHGSQAFRNKLSTARARTVRAYLAAEFKRLHVKVRITAAGSDSQRSRGATNRRAELVVK